MIKERYNIELVRCIEMISIVKELIETDPENKVEYEEDLQIHEEYIEAVIEDIGKQNYKYLAFNN